jgi:hypothetical protein
MAVVYGDMTGLLAEHSTDEATNDAIEDTARKQRASELLTKLAQNVDLPVEALVTIGRFLYEDTIVNLIWELWFYEEEEAENEPKNEVPIGPRA